MKDISLALLTGVDIPVSNPSIVIHQPSICEISMVGELQFMRGVNLLTVDTDRLGLKERISNFKFFITMMTEKEQEEAKENKAAVIEALSLIVPNAKVMATPRALMINLNGQMITIDEGNFGNFQQVLQQVFCIRRHNEEEDFNPSDELAAQIAEKIKKGRAKLAELKGENAGNALAKYLSVLSIATGLSLNECKGYTIYQLYDALERYSLYTNWDIDIRSRLAGADAKGKPPDWMKNIHLD